MAQHEKLNIVRRDESDAMSLVFTATKYKKATFLWRIFKCHSINNLFSRCFAREDSAVILSTRFFKFAIQEEAFFLNP